MTEAKEEEYIPNPKELDGVPDLSMMIYMEMKNVLHNLQIRYCKGLGTKFCYTSISTILVAINPYERLPIYGEDVLREFYEQAKRGTLPNDRPHPYGVSARSYMRMVQRRKNQSIIVCGESGAGKTETTKILIRYLAITSTWISQEAGGSASATANQSVVNLTDSLIEKQIIASSPILEAFGNAKTVLNNNSSRFGKFTKLLYDVPDGSRYGRILGSYLETYLLEKSRVVKPNQDERNYHIFYMLHAGLPPDMFQELALSDAADFWYSKQGGCTSVPGINDVENFNELTESLSLMRIEDDQQPDLWRLVGGILHLGNINFIREGDGFCSVDPATSHHLETSARLWGIEPTALQVRLETATLIIMKKKITKKVNFDDAATNRDSIAKSLYENAFLFLGARINAELYNLDENIENELFIGILDVFGFENFKDNTLEQFCINFTNEKLQQFFNYHIIQSEQEEYIKESVFWTPLSIPDNVECIEMIENQKVGFFALLDSQCRQPQPDVEAFLQELFRKHGENTTLHLAKAPSKKKKKKGQGVKFQGFELNHFADDVIYNAERFLEKNMEAIHPDTAKMLKKSSNALVVEIGGSEKKKRKKKSTVSGVFHKALQTLMKNLRQTEPYFVRCVNPNAKKSSTIWAEEVVEHQLRCGGLVEALKVLKLGYPTRVPYNTLYERYHSHVNHPLIRNMGPEAFSTAIMIAFDVDEESYELGLTKLFFKAGKGAILDTIMSQANQPLSEEQNRKITNWIVSKRLKQISGSMKSFLEFRHRVRMVRAAATWKHVGRVGSILGYTVRRYLVDARRRVLERKQNEAAERVQTMFRGVRRLKEYRERMEKTKWAADRIWVAFHRMNERRMLQEWLDVKVEETKERLANDAALAEAARLEEQRRRMEAEKKKMMEDAERKRLEMEKQMEEQRKRMEEEQRKFQEELQRQMEEARQQQEEQRKKMEEQRKLEAERAMAREHTTRNLLAAQHIAEASSQERVMAEERARRELARIEEANEKMHPEMDNSDEDSYSDSDDYVSVASSAPVTMEDKLRNFRKIATQGHAFKKFAAKRRRKPQDRVIKVTFSKEDGSPQKISWGSGSRYMEFADIEFIVIGHWTPAFQVRAADIDADLCVSIVGRESTLDIAAHSPETAELWTRGLRELIGQTEEEALGLADSRYNDSSEGSSSSDDEYEMQRRKKKRGSRSEEPRASRRGQMDMTDEREEYHKHKHKHSRDSSRGAKRASIIANTRLSETEFKKYNEIPRQLFNQTYQLILELMKNEGVYDIDVEVECAYDPDALFRESQKRGIDPQGWQGFVREKITKYCEQHMKHVAKAAPAGWAGLGSFFSAGPEKTSQPTSQRASQNYTSPPVQPVPEDAQPRSTTSFFGWFGGSAPAAEEKKLELPATQTQLTTRPSRAATETFASVAEKLSVETPPTPPTAQEAVKLVDDVFATLGFSDDDDSD